MESKASEVGSEAAGAPAEVSEQVGAAQGADSCCVFETTLSEGRPVKVCVATCCGAPPAA